MKYIKDGRVYEEVRTVLQGGMRIINPSHEQILAAGYRVYVEPALSAPTSEDLLMQIKSEKISALELYDESDSVNEFFVGEISMWFDKETRASLRLRFESEEAVGRTETTVWSDGARYFLPIQTAKIMLARLEAYASDCYDTTSQHRVNIANLDTVEEVEAYNYTLNYPDKLHFTYEGM